MIEWLPLYDINVIPKDGSWVLLCTFNEQDGDRHFRGVEAVQFSVTRYPENYDNPNHWLYILLNESCETMYTDNILSWFTHYFILPLPKELRDINKVNFPTPSPCIKSNSAQNE